MKNDLDKLEREKELRLLIGMPCDCVNSLYDLHLYEYVMLSSTRYAFRDKMNRDRSMIWRSLIGDTCDLNDTEFLAEFRMSKPMFEELYYMLKDKKAFDFKCRRECLPIQLHLMVYLSFIGSNGNNCTALRLGRKFGIASGSVLNLIERTVSAILEYKNEVLRWPDEEERNEIAEHVYNRAGFVNCVGVIDGTHFPLEFKPTLKGEEYYTRKGNYAVHGLIVSDHLARIRWIKVGWAGSVHDNRVWSTCDLNLFRDRFFSKRQYLLGDSAFKPSSVMIPSFKKPYRAQLSPQKEYFNTKLAQVRIRSEHCIGVLKARFQYLKRCRVIIKNKRTMVRLLRYIISACILHNLVIEDRVPREWLQKDDDCGDDLLEDDELNQAIDFWHINDDTRRSQLLSYILEKTGM